jgi:hypothetical protein
MGTGKVLLAVGLCAALVGAAQAQDRHYHDRHEFWAGDIHHFHEHDLALWRGGHWIHVHHGGRFGWWWVVGGVWYFYPAPVYPYPDPFQPPVAVVTSEPAAPHYWYYCNAPQGYYPYVPECAGPWQRQIAAAADPAAGPAVGAMTAPPSAMPVPPAPPAPAPTAQYWYFCDNPHGYYPSVPQCSVPWQRMPASTPPGG